MNRRALEIHRNEEGISLLEILLAIAILAFMGIYFSRMIHFVDLENKVEQGRERMEQVVSQLRGFYRSQLRLPEPDPNPRDASLPGIVPLQQLNLSQKHRLDPWGQYLRYFRADFHPGTQMTNISGYRVNGRDAAGVLISLGPNQVQDYTEDSTATPPSFTSQGDDLLIPVTLEEEAWNIAMEALEALDKRVAAYDRFFAGVNNGGSRTYVLAPREDPPEPWDPYPNPAETSYELVDEDGCVAAQGGSRCVGCVCLSRGGNNLLNDPSCGRATIDDCQQNDAALNDILVLYGLGTGAGGGTERYRRDPWGNLYQWGNGGSLPRNDRRYHLFYSMGPDRLPNTDDDITPY